MAPKFSDKPRLMMRYIGSSETSLWPTSVSAFGAMAAPRMVHAFFALFTHEMYPFLLVSFDPQNDSRARRVFESVRRETSSIAGTAISPVRLYNSLAFLYAISRHLKVCKRHT